MSNVRLSPKKNERIENVAMELIVVADEIADARPELSELMRELGKGLIDAGYPKQFFIPFELPDRVTLIQVGRKISFQLSK